MNAITTNKAIESEPKSSTGPAMNGHMSDRLREQYEAQLELPFVAAALGSEVCYWRPAAVPETESGLEIDAVAETYVRALVDHMRTFGDEIDMSDLMVSVAQAMFEGGPLGEMERGFFAFIGAEIAASRPQNGGASRPQNGGASRPQNGGASVPENSRPDPDAGIFADVAEYRRLRALVDPLVLERNRRRPSRSNIVMELDEFDVTINALFDDLEPIEIRLLKQTEAQTLSGAIALAAILHEMMLDALPKDALGAPEDLCHELADNCGLAIAKARRLAALAPAMTADTPQAV